jgi:hypothetical protein
LLPEILHLRPDAKIIVLYSGLRSFLESIAFRGAGGRVLARQIFRGFAAAIPLETTFTVEEQLLLTDMQIAAHAWLMQSTFLASIVRHYGHTRVRTLNSESLLGDPAKTLAKTGGFFDLDVSPSRWAQIATGPVFCEHAKQPGVAFDAEKYRAQHAAAAGAHANEIRVVEDWATQVAQRSNAALTLGDTLLV